MFLLEKRNHIWFRIVFRCDECNLEIINLNHTSRNKILPKFRWKTIYLRARCVKKANYRDIRTFCGIYFLLSAVCVHGCIVDLWDVLLILTTGWLVILRAISIAVFVDRHFQHHTQLSMVEYLFLNAIIKFYVQSGQITFSCFSLMGKTNSYLRRSSEDLRYHIPFGLSFIGKCRLNIFEMLSIASKLMRLISAQEFYFDFSFFVFFGSVRQMPSFAFHFMFNKKVTVPFLPSKRNFKIKLNISGLKSLVELRNWYSKYADNRYSICIKANKCLLTWYDIQLIACLTIPT